MSPESLSSADAEGVSRRAAPARNGPDAAAGAAEGARQDASRLKARVSPRAAEQPRRAPAAKNAACPEVAVSSVPRRMSKMARGLPRPRLRLKRILALLVMFAIAWPFILFFYGNSKLQHIDALSGAADTPGTTYLIVGSDKREAGVLDDGWEGERADTIMLLQLPAKGNSSLVSIPRDALVEIPGYGMAKINASYAYGGPKLLVQSVENLTGMAIDRYVEVSMGGVQNMVDAVGGVELCYDHDVDDADSQMVWSAGCHKVDGKEALAFSRMRKADPEGDIGRQKRQRQVVSKVIRQAASPATLLRPDRELRLVDAAASNLVANEGASLLSLAQAGLGLTSVMGDGGLMGAPPIASINYWYNGQSCVLIDPETSPAFWARMRDGELTREDLAIGTE